MNLLINKKTLEKLKAYKARKNRSMTAILGTILFEWGKRDRVTPVEVLKLTKNDPVSVHVNFMPQQKAAINSIKRDAGLKSYEMVDLAWWQWRRRNKNG